MNDIRKIKIELPGLTPINTADGFDRWVRKKSKDRWMKEVAAMVHGHKPKEPFQYAQIIICRYSKTRPDYDNLVQGGKFLLDGLVSSKIILDDDWECVGRPLYDWIFADEGEQRMLINIERVEDSPGFWC